MFQRSYFCSVHFVERIGNASCIVHTYFDSFLVKNNALVLRERDENVEFVLADNLYQGDIIQWPILY